MKWLIRGPNAQKVQLLFSLENVFNGHTKPEIFLFLILIDNRCVMTNFCKKKITWPYIALYRGLWVGPRDFKKKKKFALKMCCFHELCHIKGSLFLR